MDGLAACGLFVMVIGFFAYLYGLGSELAGVDSLWWITCGLVAMLLGVMLCGVSVEGK